MSIDKDDESIIFAQVDADLDSHPKVRKAGSFGRQVFEFVLRRNARRGFAGFVPIAYVDPDYLAEQLMISADDAVTGVTKAVTAKLIEVDEGSGVVRIVGWHPSWGRKSKDGAERQRNYIARKKAKELEAMTSSDASDVTPSSVTGSDESDAIREEKKREEIPDTHTRAIPLGLGARLGIAIWSEASRRHSALKAEGIDPSAIGWGDPFGDGWNRCKARIAELLEVMSPDEARKVLDHVLQVRAAEARDKRHLKFFIPMRVFDASNFAFARSLTPTQVVEGDPRKPAQKSRAPGALKGAADPRTDHPEGDRLIPINEL